ncbi:hypothetical protein H2204_000036 [Knufia peltigerae]|uniref:Acyl-protein thioesterase 1 n=1 Tax=Knufia peltigerae TaxID=1002370 RepID=A0AA39D3P1_9EURO|nr:hypothetical protein H2204_000036 [Knufia peltigerae]
MAGRQALVVPALKKHSATWCGLVSPESTSLRKATLNDRRVSLAESWRRRGKFEDVKFVFPNAPNIPITVNMGMSMPGWYDITEFSDLNQQQDEPGILRSRVTFNKLIADEIEAGIPSNRIILGGFSQGGAMSIFTGVTTTHKLGGVFGLSCYLVLAGKIKEFAKEASDVNKDTPFFMGHGDSDEVVKYKWGQQTAEFLRKELGHKVDFKTYR